MNDRYEEVFILSICSAEIEDIEANPKEKNWRNKNVTYFLIQKLP